jgi:hypothetical protein
MDTQGHVPMIGDADDAQMVRLSHGEAESPYRSLLASCALLFKRGDFKAKAGTLDDKTRWLFGAEGIPAWEALPAAGRPRAGPHGLPGRGLFAAGRPLGHAA